MMQKEIDSAVQFICGLLRARRLSLDLVETFRRVLCEVMYGRYDGHWFPEKPCKGSAYRCMRINDRNIDPLIVKAGHDAGLTIAQLLQLLPNQLTIWVDPEEVAYRIGEDGSIGVLYNANAPPPPPCSDDDDSDLCSSSGRGSSVGSGSSKSSPSQSPIPSSTDDDLSSSSSSLPPSPRVYGGSSTTSCRQEMTKQVTMVGVTVGTSSISSGSVTSSATSATGQYLNSVLIASS